MSLSATDYVISSRASIEPPAAGPDAALHLNILTGESWQVRARGTASGTPNLFQLGTVASVDMLTLDTTRNMILNLLSLTGNVSQAVFIQAMNGMSLISNTSMTIAGQSSTSLSATAGPLTISNPGFPMTISSGGAIGITSTLVPVSPAGGIALTNSVVTWSNILRGANTGSRIEVRTFGMNSTNLDTPDNCAYTAFDSVFPPSGDDYTGFGADGVGGGAAVKSFYGPGAPHSSTLFRFIAAGEITVDPNAVGFAGSGCTSAMMWGNDLVAHGNFTNVPIVVDLTQSWAGASPVLQMATWSRDASLIHLHIELTHNSAPPVGVAFPGTINNISITPDAAGVLGVLFPTAGFANLNKASSKGNFQDDNGGFDVDTHVVGTQSGFPFARSITIYFTAGTVAGALPAAPASTWDITWSLV